VIPVFASTFLSDPLVVSLRWLIILAYGVLCGLSLTVFFKKGRKTLFLFLAAAFSILMIVELGSFYFEPMLGWLYYYLVWRFEWLRFSLDYMYNAQLEVWLILQSLHFLVITVFGLAMILAGRVGGKQSKEGEK